MRTVATPSDFDFASAVCSHGFFVLAPNDWERQKHVLRTVVPDGPAGAVAVELSSRDRVLHIRIPRSRTVRNAAQDRAVAMIERMLRLDEDLAPFHRKCATSTTHADAARRRFGRLIRSATLFEDAVKVICTCNVTWRQTTAMVDALTRQYGAPAVNDPARRAFPTPGRLAEPSVDDLKTVARVGYRATSISRLARSVASGRIDLEALEDPDMPTEQLPRRLRELPGIGPYGAANLCMLLGRYDQLAVDTELLRFWREHYPRRRQTVRAIRRHYQRWQPYAFLAYWWELWRGYAETHGDPAGWSAEAQGRRITVP